MRPDFSGSLCNVRRSLGCGMGFFVVICTAARCLAQAPPLPAYLTLPAQVQMKTGFCPGRLRRGAFRHQWQARRNRAR